MCTLHNSLNIKTSNVLTLEMYMQVTKLMNNSGILCVDAGNPCVGYPTHDP